MSADGDVLARQRERTVEGFELTRGACERFLALDARARAGDTSVAADLLIARIEMGAIGFADAKKAAGELDRPAAEKKLRLFELLLDLEVEDVMSGVRTRTQAVAAGRRFADMWGEGRVPKGRAASSFFAVIMEAAYADSDAKLYERALTHYEKVAPRGPNRTRVLERLRRRLDEIKG